MNNLSAFTLKAPGRVFLFGEHSDYLGLEVISAAINQYITISSEIRKDKTFKINLLNYHKTESFVIGEKLTYKHSRDYLRSAYNVLREKGIQPLNGAQMKVFGNIPIAAGLSSSSAFAVACIMAFSKLANTTITREQIAQYAYEAEVVEFGESGGMMDHLSSVFGKIIHVNFGDNFKLRQLPSEINGFVIGDSLEKKKNTVGDLKIIRTSVENGYNLLKKELTDFNHKTTPLDKIIEVIEILPEPIRTITLTTIQNRDLTREALKYLEKKNPESEIIGQLIVYEHKLLRDGLNRSTPKIEKMIKNCLNAGALGCKINGSGGGGSILAYAPGKEKEVSKAIKKSDGIPYIIKISEGASFKNI